MAGTHYRIDLEGHLAVTEQLNQLLERSAHLKPVFASMGEMLLLSHDERFRKQVTPQGVPWEPLSQSYQARKPKRQDTILTLNSLLSGTLTYQAEDESLDFGTPLIYGAIHQFGGSGFMRPQNAAIPKREWLGVSPDDYHNIADRLATFLMEG